mgnify:CR=1 FL=1
MDISSIMVQQMAQEVNNTINMVKQANKSDQAVLSLMQVAENLMQEVEPTATRGNNVNMII